MNVRKRSKLRPVELDGFVGKVLIYQMQVLVLANIGKTFASEVIFESSNRPNRNISYERLDTRNPRFKIPDEAYRQLSQIKTPVKAYSERESDESETTEETQTSEDSEDIDDGADSDLSEEECSTSGEELPATTPLTGQDDVFRGISATKHLQRADWILHEHTLSSVGHVGRPYSNPGQAHLMRAGGAWIEVPEEIYGE
ncbi:hypothetical protein M501DRAFT_1004728 [Patellaria atrata CBS 101060]|uniref:Uncharacterized protein n=1 Tax=Patellaria atrata CBS 101060 TaxID=1346257 RepID=A0A9P4VR06_9PEZI|nr:hypothetical protein M501DRAFT_1004728 [Patellaria atrata CBS 101060]